MFLHIGKDEIVPKKDIIAIIDIKSIKKSQINQAYINKHLKKGLIKEALNKEKEKSYVIGVDKIYQSSISSNTLKKRSESYKIQ